MTKPKDPLGYTKQAVREGRVVMAPDDVVRTLRPEIDQVLAALGFRRALVTDESSCGDFGVDLTLAAKTLGVALSDEDLLIDVAKRLRLKKMS
jgi:hypothetical protein